MRNTTQCEFVGGGEKHLSNAEDYKCKNEATKVLHGHKKSWHFCDVHYNLAIAFLHIVKETLKPQGAA